MCILCERVKSKDKSSHFIHEFKHSLLFVGEHQYFPGYCVLYLKDHETDLTSLSDTVQREFFSEVMKSAKAIKNSFNPAKINYSCLGNVVDHIHYHIFPRSSDELDKQSKKDPWANDHLFNSKITTKTDALMISKKIKEELCR